MERTEKLDEVILNTVKKLAAGSGTGRPPLALVLEALREVPTGEMVRETGALMVAGRLIGTPGMPYHQPCLVITLPAKNS